MGHKAAGFSLIEALVSVLVLSIGMLGLARLQASLWSAASDLHSSRQAHAFASAELEKSLFHVTADTASSAPASAELVTAVTRFRASTSVTLQGRVLSATTRVDWNGRSGADTLALRTARATEQHPADARWLLAPAAPTTAYLQKPTAHPHTPENRK